jgi:hypothetical protein
VNFAPVYPSYKGLFAKDVFRGVGRGGVGPLHKNASRMLPLSRKYVAKMVIRSE